MWRELENADNLKEAHDTIKSKGLVLLSKDEK